MTNAERHHDDDYFDCKRKPRHSKSHVLARLLALEAVVKVCPVQWHDRVPLGAEG